MHLLLEGLIASCDLRLLELEQLKDYYGNAKMHDLYINTAIDICEVECKRDAYIKKQTKLIYAPCPV